MTEENNPRLVKIGELLIAVGVLTTGDLTEAIQISKRMGVPIGRVLVMSGCVSEPDLQQALELQSLIKDGLVDLDTGIKALEKVFKDKTDLQSALKELNWTPNKDAAGNKLGDLLVDSSIVSRGQLDRALEASFQSGMPLGGTLVLQGVLSPQLLPTVLHTQEQIRDGKMNREEAINMLKQALMFWAKADSSKQDELQSLSRSNPSNSGTQGAVAATGNLAPPPSPGLSASSAMPVASSGAPAAQSANPAIPLEMPSIPATGSGIEHDNVSAYLAGTVGGESMSAKQKLADTLESEVRPPQQAPAEGNMVSLIELLKLSGFCTQNTIDMSIQQALNDNRLASKLLLAIGFVDADTLNTYVRCQAMIARGILRTDQVLYVLNSMRHRKITFEQAVQELGVQVPV